MNAYDFTLIVEGTEFLEDDVVDAVYEAGCDDATVGVSVGVPCADFTREAPSLEEAALSAITDIESVDGIEVIRIADAGNGAYQVTATDADGTRVCLQMPQRVRC